ncbi:MAG: peptide chain release factor N(5)-glutamine methyltransferase [Clostridia bacterium]|nr:peptide chain release factor N(5)-glutamine methyltransferase [Clostridia bacterium]
MVIGNLLKEATAVLSAAGIESARLDSEVLLSHVLKKDRLYLVMHRNDEADETVEAAFRELVARREKSEPVAYLTGSREFMSLEFSVCPGVLIPRPDTETLVEFVIEKFSERENPSILDLCTGSGAIAVSLAHYLPNSRVTAADISDLCVTVAGENAEKNGVSDRVTVLQQDVFAYESEEPFDCVVSNPPYIPSEVVYTLEKDVKDYEPHLALDGGEDGYTFYRYLSTKAVQLLKSGGLLVLEVGHDQAETVAGFLRETNAYKTVGTKQDLAGINRVVYGIKN